MSQLFTSMTAGFNFLPALTFAKEEGNIQCLLCRTYCALNILNAFMHSTVVQWNVQTHAALQLLVQLLIQILNVLPQRLHLFFITALFRKFKSSVVAD
jgi:hypothetical protein